MSDFTRFCPDFVPIFYDKPRKSLTYRVLGGVRGSYKPKAQIDRSAAEGEPAPQPLPPPRAIGFCSLGWAISNDRDG